MSKRAVVIVGHGSRSAEATEQFVRLTDSLEPRLPGTSVFPAFMELAEPSFSASVSKAVQGGAEEIVVVPCFLFTGNHIKHDIPDMVNETSSAYPEVTFSLRDPIGPDPRVVEILLDRLGVGPEAVWGERGPAEIEAESMRVIEASLRGIGDAAERDVVKRLLHASGDMSLQDSVGFSADAVTRGVSVLRAGATVVTDVRMVECGIDSRRLAAMGGETRCAIDEPEVAAEAAATGRTRAATSMRSLASQLDGAVVAIGNAPSALREVLAIAEEGLARPALVVGMPVGFVDAAESKSALERSSLDFITVRGARGGSPLAAAAVNALLRLAEKDAEE